MKAMFVASHYHPYTGGVEYVVKSVAERLVRRGHEVTVLCGESSIDNPKEEWVNDVHVVRWPVRAPGDAYHIPRMRNELRDWLVSTARGCDVVHLHSVHSVLTVYSLRVLRGCDVRKVVTPHYHGTGHTALRKLLWKFWRPYVREVLRGCTLHAVSRFEASLIERDFGSEPIVIEHGVEEWVREVVWRPEDYVLYSGRIERYKNVELLAMIVKILNEQYGCDLRLKIQGRGSHRERVIETLRKLGIPFEVEDFKPYREYIETLSRAKLFGLLSEKEAFGQSVNEATAIGVPAVVAKPWGLNFEGRKRTLVVDLDQDVNTLVKNVYEFMMRAPLEERSHIPTWSEVIQEYVKKLYSKFE